MISTLLAIATFITAIATYYKQKKIIASYQGLLETFFSMRELTEKLTESNQGLVDLIKNSNNLHNWYIPSVKYLLIALSKYVEEMKKQSVKDERYEEAKKCNEALLEMYKLINA